MSDEENELYNINSFFDSGSDSDYQILDFDNESIDLFQSHQEGTPPVSDPNLSVQLGTTAAQQGQPFTNSLQVPQSIVPICPFVTYPCPLHPPPLQNEAGDQQIFLPSGFHQNISFTNAQNFGTLNCTQNQNYFSCNYENVLSGPDLVSLQYHDTQSCCRVLNTKNGSELTFQAERFQKQYYSMFLDRFDNKNILNKKYVKISFDLIAKEIHCPSMTRDESRCIKLFFNNRAPYADKILMCLRNNIKVIKDTINFSELEKEIEKKKMNSKRRMKKN